MSLVHETAIVHPDVKLGKDVTIGAYTIVEKDVSIGDNTWIGPHVVIRKHTDIGAENRIYQFSSIGEEPQYQGYQGEVTRLQIGNRNIIREYCTLNRGTALKKGVTSIGDENFLMAYVHIAHDCQVGNKTIFANGSSLAGHVDVGDCAILGGFSLVHQFCKVGAHCITGIGAICFQDIPPFIIAAGNSAKPYGINVKGLRRREFSENTITLLRRAYKLLYRNNLDLKSAMEEISNLDSENDTIAVLNDFLSHSERGIIR